MLTSTARRGPQRWPPVLHGTLQNRFQSQSLVFHFVLLACHLTPVGGKLNPVFSDFVHALHLGLYKLSFNYMELILALYMICLAPFYRYVNRHGHARMASPL